VHDAQTQIYNLAKPRIPSARSIRLFIGNLNVARVDLVDDVMWRLAVDRAPHRLCSPQNFLHGTREGLSERARAHGAGNVKNFIKGDVSSVLDVFLLLPVTRRL